MNISKMVIVLVLLMTVLNSVLLYKVYNTMDNLVTTAAVVQVPDENQPDAQPSAPIVVNVKDDPVMGSKNAPVTIIEFSDYQCPYCGKFASETFPQIKTMYIDTGKVKFIYKDFPLGFHDNAQKASEAAECADEQGKFWEYNDKLYQNQQDLAVESLKRFAADLGLDTKKFNECLDSGKMAAEVHGDMQDGSSAGISGTPAFLINGIGVTGAQPFEVFQQIIDAELSK